MNIKIYRITILPSEVTVTLEVPEGKPWITRKEVVEIIEHFQDKIDRSIIFRNEEEK